MVVFRYDDGQILWTDGDTIEWDGPGLIEGRMLDQPHQGSIIVFVRDGRNEVEAWTYETELHDCLLHESSVQFRIVDDKGTVLWYGLYSQKYDDIAQHGGQRPRELQDHMSVEIGNNPHGKNPYGKDVFWEPAYNQEQFWGYLFEASKK